MCGEIIIHAAKSSFSKCTAECQWFVCDILSMIWFVIKFSIYKRLFNFPICFICIKYQSRAFIFKITYT